MSPSCGFKMSAHSAYIAVFFDCLNTNSDLTVILEALSLKPANAFTKRDKLNAHCLLHTHFVIL